MEDIKAPKPFKLNKPINLDNPQVRREPPKAPEPPSTAANIKVSTVETPVVGRRRATPVGEEQPTATVKEVFNPLLEDDDDEEFIPSIKEETVSKPEGEATSTAKSRSKNKRRLLNKHDFGLLHFLAKADYCTTRQLAIALDRRGDEDALRRKLKGLEASGYTAVYKRTGGKDLWMVTAKTIVKLKKQGLIPLDSRLKSRDPASITGAKIGHTLAVAQMMAWLFRKDNSNPEVILSEREIRSYHLAMKACAAKNRPSLYRKDEQEAVFKEYSDRVSIAAREDLSPTLAEELDGFSFESEQSPEEVFPELFRPMVDFEGKPYGQSPDFVLVWHRTQAGQGPTSAAVEVELHPKTHGDYCRILSAYRDSPFIGSVVFYVPFAEEKTYMKDGKEEKKVRLEDRIKAAAIEVGWSEGVVVKYLLAADGSHFTGDAWGL